MRLLRRSPEGGVLPAVISTGNRIARWFPLRLRHLLQCLVVAQRQGGGDLFRLNGEGTHWQRPERTEHPDADSRRRLFHQVESGVVIHILPRGPDPRHPGPFRIGQFSHPARHRCEAESGIVREHHGDVRRAIRDRALAGAGCLSGISQGGPGLDGPAKCEL